MPQPDVNERAKVVALRSKGEKWDDIAEQTAFSKRGAQKVFKIWEDMGRIEKNSNSSGRRDHAIDERTKEEIEAHVRKNPWDMLEEITEDWKLNVTPRSVVSRHELVRYYL
jgi:hypothetical protein